jgi:hypothetical protein
MTRHVALALACLAGLLALPSVAAADEAEWMYDPGQVVEIRLGGLSGAELDELEAKPDEYVHGSFELLVDGVVKGTALADVGIRLKGGVGSSRPVKTGKSGFKVRFDEFVKGQLFFVSQRVSATLDGERVRACSIQAHPPGAGRVGVGCRLQERIRDARAGGPMRLRVRVRFAPEGGRASSVLRVLSAPQRG